MSFGLSLKLAEFPQNETIFVGIMAEFFGQNSGHLEYKYRAIDLRTC
jgi:UDP-galactopyranose mutase